MWFILNDVCAILEIANARDTKSRLDKGDVGITEIIDNRGRIPKMTVINEYALKKINSEVTLHFFRKVSKFFGGELQNPLFAIVC